MASNAWQIVTYTAGVGEDNAVVYFRQEAELANDGVYLDLSITSQESSDVERWHRYGRDTEQAQFSGKTTRTLEIAFRLRDRDGEDVQTIGSDDILPPREYHPVKPTESNITTITPLEILETAFRWQLPVYIRYAYTTDSTRLWRGLAGGRGTRSESIAYLIADRSISQQGRQSQLLISSERG